MIEAIGLNHYYIRYLITFQYKLWFLSEIFKLLIFFYKQNNYKCFINKISLKN
jgi:hypothetical protein